MRLDSRYSELGCLMRKQFDLPDHSVYLTDLYCNRMISIIRKRFESGTLNKEASDYLIFNMDLILPENKTEQA